jgi:hypothetical protein
MYAESGSEWIITDASAMYVYQDIPSTPYSGKKVGELINGQKVIVSNFEYDLQNAWKYVDVYGNNNHHVLSGWIRAHKYNANRLR